MTFLLHLYDSFTQWPSSPNFWPELLTQWSAVQSHVLSVMTQPLLTSSIVSTPAFPTRYGRNWVPVFWKELPIQLYHQIEPSVSKCIIFRFKAKDVQPKHGLTSQSTIHHYDCEQTWPWCSLFFKVLVFMISRMRNSKGALFRTSLLCLLVPHLDPQHAQWSHTWSLQSRRDSRVER